MTRPGVAAHFDWPPWLEGQEAWLLKHYLHALEQTIRRELADPRRSHSGDRRRAYMEALKEIAAARLELKRCPEGAGLALLVSQAILFYTARDIESRQKGAATTNADQRPRVERRHNVIRSCAATLSPDLSASAKARFIKTKYSLRLSLRQIRRIISK